MKHSIKLRNFLLASYLLVPSSNLHAADFTWTGATNGNWDTVTNWNLPPTFSANNGIIFSGTPTTTSTFLGDNAPTIGTISFDQMNSSVLVRLDNGGSSSTSARNITLGSTTVAPAITVKDSVSNSSTVNHIIGSGVTGNIVLLNDLTVDVNGLATGATSTRLTIGRPITGTGRSLTKDGTGTLILSQNNTFTGTTTVREGVLQIGTGGVAGTLGNNSNTSIASGAELRFDRSTSSIGYNYEGTLSGSGTVNIPAVRRTNYLSNQTTSGDLSFEVDGILGIQTGGTALVTAVHLGELSGIGVIQRANIVGGAATLFIGGKGTSSTYSGTIVSNELGVEKTGTGTLTLTGSNTYTRATTVTAGILSLGNSLALQNSVLDMANTIAGDASNGLRTTVTSLTLGGLTGNKNLANVFTTTSGGYDTVTALSLNTLADENHDYSGAIDGACSLTKTGTGTQTLSGTNTYSGTTTGTGGTLLTTQATALSGYNVADKVIFGGGIIGVHVGGSGWTTAEVDTLMSNATKTSGALGIVTTNGSITQWTAFTTTNLGNTLGLAKLGTNTLVLDKTNTYAGATTISDGMLQLGVGGTSGSLTGTSGITNNSRLTVNRGDAFTQTSDLNNKAITGNGSFTQAGTGTTTLSLANTYTGDTYINQGTLAMESNLIANSPTIFISNGATLSVTGANGFALAENQAIQGTGLLSQLTMTGGNAISTTGGGLTLQCLSVGGNNNQMTAGNITSGVAGERCGLLVGNGSTGTFTLSGGTFTSIGGTSHIDLIGMNNTFGTFSINGGSYVNSGTLAFGIGDVSSRGGTLTLNSGSATIGTLVYDSSTTTGNFGTVNLNGGTLTLGAITSTSGNSRQFNFNGGQFVASGTVNFANTLALNVKDGGAKIDTNGNSVTVGGNLENDGAGGLTKSGAGTLTLTGTSTYTGATTVSDGTLAVTGSLSATAVSVNAGTLAGNGSIGGNVTIASGAHHALAVAATTGAQVTRVITGTLTLTAGNILDLTAASTPTVGEYVLATASVAITGTPTTVNYNGITGTVTVDTASTPKRLLLTVTGGGFASWQTNHGTTGTLADDHDNDGVSNGVEYFIGGPNGNTTGFTALPSVDKALDGTLSVTWTKGSGYSGDYGTDFIVETSNSLEGTWNAETADPTVGFTVTFPSATAVKFTFPTVLGSKNFARLKVTGP